MTPEKQIIRAEWIATMDPKSRTIRDGAVAFSGGRILAVGAANQVIKQHPDAHVHELGKSVVLPGLINAHTHLELSNCVAGDSCAGNFADWILRLQPQKGSPEEGTRRGIEQSLRFGVTCIGDISQLPGITRRIIAASPIRCVSFGEVIGLAQRRFRFDELLPQAIDTQYASERLHIGLTPHAPYTLDQECYEQALRIAKERSLPFTTHLAELPEEHEFLESQTGMFRDLWEKLGWWSGGVQTYHGSPIQFARAIGLLDYPTLLAHVNYCDDDELATLALGKAAVVYCPRTHRYFGHPPHRWRGMLERGINVIVGTDSCASSPDLNLVEELRLVRSIAPDLPAWDLWEMATVRAARALSMQNEIGLLAAGWRADFVAFESSGSNPLETVLSDQGKLPQSVWIDGATIQTPRTG